jgi:hypothetical protein
MSRKYPYQACGCRRSTVKRKGHRPACLEFDMDRFRGRRNVAQFRRRWNENGGTASHARGVILAA